MSTVVNKIGGIIPNVFDPGKLEEWQKYFQRWSMTGDDRLNCYGIDENNKGAEQWFQKNIFSTVKKVLENDKITSIFGMYAESVQPYFLHSDTYVVDEYLEKTNKKGEPSISWLIPYKVDGKQENISRASTIIFNETENWRVSNEKDAVDDYKNTIDDSMRERYFTHCDPEKLKKVSIYEVIHWQPGSLIYWDQRNLHCSGSFNGFKTKEMFVGHTYIPHQQN